MLTPRPIPLLVVLTAACAASEPPPRSPARPEPAVTYRGQGAESVAPELVAKFSPPPVTPALSRRIQHLMDVRAAGGGVLTSRGDRLVFTWSVTGVAQVWRMDGPRSFPVQLTGGEDRTTIEAISPDDRWIVVSRDVGGAEQPGLYVVDIDGGPLREILHRPKVRARLAFISDDARWVYYTANDVVPETATLYRWERATGQRQRLLDEPGLWIPADHRGDEILLAKALGSTRIELHLFDVASRERRPLFGQDEAVRYDAKFGARPGTFLVKHDRDGDFSRLYEWKDGRFAPITPAVAHDVDDFTIDEKRTRIAYTTNEGGYQRLHVLDARTYEELPLPALPEAENVAGGAMSRDGRFMALSVDGSRLPPTTVFFDWKGKKTVAWRLVSMPEVDVASFARATLEHYPARDGTQIPMFVRRPDACPEPCPVIVELHGGPEGQSRPGFNPRAQAYVDAGFVLVQPNVRGSSGYGKAWVDADNGRRRLDVITDIEDCALHIRKAWAKDGKPPRIGVTGASYGGYSTLLAMTYFAGAYDVGVSEVGPANLLTFLQSTAAYRRRLRTSEYGDPEKDQDVLAKLSPLTYVDRLSGPLLLIQGVNDPRVPVGEAVLMFDAARRRNREVEMILFPDEGHGMTQRSNKALAFGNKLAFFEKHLK